VRARSYTTKCVAIFCSLTHYLTPCSFSGRIIQQHCQATKQSIMSTFQEQGASHSPSTVSASTASGNIDDALVLAPAAVGNTEDVVVVASPLSGAQASNDNNVQIVGTPRAVAVEERPHKKSKSNNGTKHKKRPPISDTNLKKQVNQVRDTSGGGNIVDSSLRLTQLLDTNNNNEDDANKEVKEGTKYFTMPVPCGKSFPWWEGFELFIPVKHPTLYNEHVLCKEWSTFKNNPDA
jgi:hypothetical protein